MSRSNSPFWSEVERFLSLEHVLFHTQDRGHYGYTLNFGVKNAQLRSKTASSSTTLKVELFLEGGKTSQLRSKTASSSTTLKVEVFLEGGKTSQLRSKTASSSTTLFLWSLHGHYAVTTRSLRGHYGHYAVTTVTTSLRGHYGHSAVTTVTTRKSTCSRLRKRSTSLQNGLFDRALLPY